MLNGLGYKAVVVSRGYVGRAGKNHPSLLKKKISG